MEELNSLSLERLQFVSDYYKLVIQLENYLSSARSDISKARTLQGVALSSIFGVDVQSPEANTRVAFNDGKFTLVDSAEVRNDDESESKVRKRKEDDASKKEQEDDKPKVKHIPNFRPFGVFEPLCAKEARKTMHSALEIVCELATLQCEIKRIDSRTLSVKESLNLDSELSEKLEHILKV
ncbi:hypothetical protein TELCIR_07402 [Teladorsagia circumcincta]|uniref:Vacuolar ATPase assembly protein VMA22 n=1 Tax=Teladorsagia circumcincta TaxID=45464 RepID=A0A2G9ULX1_TELCI|nr:hypothetical protein TELCIR_07402 [Teladorsagia circumcincta]